MPLTQMMLPRSIFITAGARATASLKRLRRDSLARNSAYIMSTNGMSAVLGYAYWILATHVYSPHDVGLGAALIAAMMVAASLVDVGLAPLLIQVLPTRAAGSAWSLSLNVALMSGALLGTVSAALAVGVLPVLSTQFSVLREDISFAGIFVLSVPLWITCMLLDSMFVAERSAASMLLRTSVFAALKIPVLVLPPLVQLGAFGIVTSWTIGTTASAIVALLLIPRLQRVYRFTLKGARAELTTVRSSLLWQHGIGLGNLLPTYLLPIMVSVRLSATANAYFYTTWRLGAFLFTVSPAVSQSLFAEGMHANERLAMLIRRSVITIAAILAPFMLAYLIVGKRILLLFGPAYALHGAALLAVLVIAAVPDAVTNVAVSVLRVRVRLGQAALLVFCIAVVALGLAWVLLPRFGVVGGGLGWLGGQLVGTVVVGVSLLLRRQRSRLSVTERGADPTAHSHLVRGLSHMRPISFRRTRPASEAMKGTEDP